MQIAPGSQREIRQRIFLPTGRSQPEIIDLMIFLARIVFGSGFVPEQRVIINPIGPLTGGDLAQILRDCARVGAFNPKPA